MHRTEQVDGMARMTHQQTVVILEGITVDAAEKNAYVVSESTRTIFRIPLSGSDNDLEALDPVALGSLPRLNDGDTGPADRRRPPLREHGALR